MVPVLQAPRFMELSDPTARLVCSLMVRDDAQAGLFGAGIRTTSFRAME